MLSHDKKFSKVSMCRVVIGLGLLLFNPKSSMAEKWQEIIYTELTHAVGRKTKPSLGVDKAGNVHIAWADRRNGNWGIFYTKLDNNGTALIKDTRLTSSGNYGQNPRLGIDKSNNIHIVWEDMQNGNSQVCYTKLDSNGTTLVNDTRISSSGNSCTFPRLKIDPNNYIHIVWEEKYSGSSRICYIKLSNSGDKLINTLNLAGDGNFNQHPDVGADAWGNIHVVWEDAGYIYYTKLNNNGGQLVSNTNLTSRYSYGSNPCLGLDSSGNVHIAWKDGRDYGNEIYYTKLDNNGTTLVGESRLTLSGEAEEPDLAVDSGGNIHIIWEDGLYGGSDICYAKLDNNGNSLVIPTRLTYSGKAEKPGLGVDTAGNIHIAREDRSDSNYAICYIKGSTICDSCNYKEILTGFGSHTTGKNWLHVLDSAGNLYSSLAWVQVGLSGVNSRVIPIGGDIDGDGLDEIIIGYNIPGVGAYLEILDDSRHGYAQLAWVPIHLPNGDAFDGDIWPACGDLYGDGRKEIVVGFGKGGGGRLEILGNADTNYEHLAWINAPAYNGVYGETRPTCGDIDGDGRDEIVVGFGTCRSKRDGGKIRILDDASANYAHLAWVNTGWSAYNAANGETYPACGDIDGDGKAEIIVGFGTYKSKKDGGKIRILDDASANYAHLAWVNTGWSAYNAANGETHPACGDIDGDGKAEIIVGFGTYKSKKDGGKIAVVDDTLDGDISLKWLKAGWPAYDSANGEIWPAAATVR